MTKDGEDPRTSPDRQDGEVEGRHGYRPPPEQVRPERTDVVGFDERPDLIYGYNPAPPPPEPMTEPEQAAPEPSEPEVASGDE